MLIHVSIEAIFYFFSHLYVCLVVFSLVDEGLSALFEYLSSYSVREDYVHRLN